MKKTIALLLALVMGLSLFACGGGNVTTETKGEGDSNENQVETTADPAAGVELEKQFNIAMFKLDTSIFNGQTAAFKEAYGILSQLGDYKDAQAYLDRFTIIPDVCLMETYSKINAFGEEEYSYSVDYGYSADGKTLFDAKNCNKYSDPMATRTVYTYNNEGVVIEESIVSGGTTQEKVTITHNADGSVAQKDHLYADGTVSTQTFAYDDAGRLITMVWVEAGSTYEYAYDDNGLLVSVVGTGSEKNSFTETTQCAYDTDGNLITETICVKVPGTEQETVRSYFYENGILVRVEEKKELDGILEISYTYGDYYCYTPEN